jgi:flagellar basal body rod protein FlgG
MDLDKVLTAGLRDDNTRLSLISNNIANLSTFGYRRHMHTSLPFEVRFDAAAARDAQLTASHSGFTKTFVNSALPALVSTGRTQDVVLDGDGFLEVSTPDGTAYARFASLKIDSQGRLVNQDGFPVHAANGEIRLAPKAFNMNSRGEILQDGEVVERLRVVAPADPMSMQAIGNGLYRFSSEARPVDQGVFKVGFVEGSNVESPREMTQLLETVRHFEAFQKVAQAYGELQEKVAQRLGDF